MTGRAPRMALGGGRLKMPPLMRIIVLSVLGVALFLGMVAVSLQPATGWTADLSAWRHPLRIDPGIWTSLLTGILAYLMSVWVWALKPSSLAGTLFAVSGLMTLLFCFSSFPGSIALPMNDAAVSRFWIVNMLGASGFGIVMTCLFLIYPRGLPHWKLLAAVTIIGFGTWTLLRTFGPFRDFAEVQRITTVEMFSIIASVAWQVHASRSDPRQSAIARWLGASVLIGAGAFIGSVALPLTFGFPPLIRENYAFSFFLIIYAGLAAGLLRYRLFDLGAWAYRLVFYALAIVLLIGIDLALISLLSFGRSEAFGLSLLLVGFAYLPLRESLWQRFTRGSHQPAQALFQGVADAAFQPTAVERRQAWTELLKRYFQPLDMAPGSAGISAPRIANEGLTLYIPSIPDSPSLKLEYGRQGRALFSSNDVETVRHLVSLSIQLTESRAAYDRGVSEERLRIARDLHDNIGAQLLRALHSTAPDKKDSVIRDTVADLRDVINHSHDGALDLDEMLADLRAETAERLEPHRIGLSWSLQADAGLTLTPASIHALRSVVREAASNTIKHANASVFIVSIMVSEGDLQVQITDDGEGFATAEVHRGKGLANMKARIESVGGTFLISTEGAGPKLAATLALDGVRT